MKVAVDRDIVGVDLKRTVVAHLASLGIEVEDLDLLGSQKVDYPDVGYNLARRLANKEFVRGVLICGTGLGMAMIANKVEGIYAGKIFWRMGWQCCGALAAEPTVIVNTVKSKTRRLSKSCEK